MKLENLPEGTVSEGQDFYRNTLLNLPSVHPSGVLRLEDSTVSEGSFNEWWGYYCHGNTTVHRIMALTFLVCPGDPKDYQVNHKDGNKLNNAALNLEWCTRSENAIHAYETGLRNDNRPVLIKDLASGEIQRFATLNGSARALGVEGSHVFYYLSNTKNPKQPYRHKWSIIYEGGEWPVIDEKLITGYSKDIIAIPEDEKELSYIFNSISDASRYFDIKPATIGWYLNRLGVNKDNLHKGYRWYFLHEYIGEVSEDRRVTMEPVKKKRKERHKRTPKRLSVRNLHDDNITIWNSAQEYANDIGMKKNSLQKAILVGKGIYQGKEFRYLD